MDNSDNINLVLKTSLTLTREEEDNIMRLAAVGFMPDEIAAAMEWPCERRALFRTLSQIEGTDVDILINSGRANGRATPQIKLQEAASTGNIEAIKALQILQQNNRFSELLNNMDDDEFTP